MIRGIWKNFPKVWGSASYAISSNLWGKINLRPCFVFLFKIQTGTSNSISLPSIHFTPWYLTSLWERALFGPVNFCQQIHFFSLVEIKGITGKDHLPLANGNPPFSDINPLSGTWRMFSINLIRKALEKFDAFLFGTSWLIVSNTRSNQQFLVINKQFKIIRLCVWMIHARTSMIYLVESFKIHMIWCIYRQKLIF